MFRYLSYSALSVILFLPSLALAKNQQAGAGFEKPLIFAHRGASGLWMQNSRFAVEQSVQFYKDKPGKLHGIEVDVVLTKDNIPVISHDPWVHTELCIKRHASDKQPKPLEKILIKDLLFKDLQQQFICGGLMDKDFPQAKTKAESILGFSEFLLLLAETPNLIIYLDSKLEPPLTQSAEEYAKAIFTIWQRTGLDNPLYIEAPNKQSLYAFQQYGNTAFTAVLSSPPFFAEKHPWLRGFKALVYDFIFARSPLKKAIEAEADALAIPFSVSNKRSQSYLQKAGKKVIVFNPHNQKTIQKACDRRVDIIITDFPNLEACQ